MDLHPPPQDHHHREAVRAGLDATVAETVLGRPRDPRPA
jgi:hypothetical protein